jgi:hypothetical protein
MQCLICDKKHYAKGLCKQHYDKKSKENNKETITKQQKIYREKHKEHYKKLKQEWDTNNTEHNKKYNEQYHNNVRKKNPEYKIERKQYMRVYFQNNKQESYEAKDQRRRSIKIVEHVDREKLRKMYNNLCVWCEEKLGDIFHIDHLLPVSRYEKIGKKCPHDYNNCAPSCPSCNSSKKDKTPLEFIWTR